MSLRLLLVLVSTGVLLLGLLCALLSLLRSGG